jgi:hypothetical protein
MYIYITEVYDDRVHQQRHAYAYEVHTITRGLINIFGQSNQLIANPPPYYICPSSRE